jgi:amino acid permease
VLDMEIRWMVCAQVVNMVIIRNVLSLGNEEYLVSGKSNMCQSVGD